MTSKRMDDSVKSAMSPESSDLITKEIHTEVTISNRRLLSSLDGHHKHTKPILQSFLDRSPKVLYSGILLSLLYIVMQQHRHIEMPNVPYRIGTGFMAHLSEDDEQPWLHSYGNTTTRYMFYPNDTSILYGLPLTTIRRASVNGTVLDYLKAYKNPCWFEEDTTVNGIRCLPFLYILGVGKSGTTSIYSHLIHHNDVTKRQAKEIFWWGKVKSRYSLRKYIGFFRNSAMEIYNSTIRTGHNERFHQKLTVDATPSYFCHQGDLGLLPGNRRIAEPRYTLADTLYRVNPKTRLIVILRHPTDRMYSHYHHVYGSRASFSPEGFHRLALQSLKMMNSCLEQRSLKACVFNHTLTSSMLRTLHIPLYYSMYYPFAKTWLDVFPRKQILFIKAEDFYANSTRVMNDVFTFLGLNPDNVAFKENNQDHTTHNHKTMEYRNTLLPETRAMLDNFFAPLNRKLAELLDDERFVFRR